MFKDTRSFASKKLAWALMVTFGLATQGCAPVDDAGSDEAVDFTEVKVATLTNTAGTCTSAQWEAIRHANAGAFWLMQRAANEFHLPANRVLRDRWFGTNRNDSEVRYMLLMLAGIPGSEQQIKCEPEWSTGCSMPGVYGFHDRTNGGQLTFCPRFFGFDHNVGDTDPSGDGVSQVGGMLHEYAHRAGAFNDGLSSGYGYIAARRNVTRNNLPVFQAENWRFYLWQMGAVPALEARL
jgi:hypothetical protein